jgi:hypothetical protein
MADRTLIFHDAVNGHIVEVLAKETAPGSGIYRLGVDSTLVVPGIVIAHIDGLGVPGIPAGGVMTVQGDPAGTLLPVAPGKPDPAYLPLFGVAGAAFYSADASAAPAPVVDAPGAAARVTIKSLIVSVQSILVVTFTEETSGALMLELFMAANSTVVVPLGPDKFQLPTVNKRLMVKTSGAGKISVQTIWYPE